MGCKFFFLQLSLIVDIAYSMRIVNYLGEYGVILVVMLGTRAGKDLVRIL